MRWTSLAETHGGPLSEERHDKRIDEESVSWPVDTYERCRDPTLARAPPSALTRQLPSRAIRTSPGGLRRRGRGVIVGGMSLVPKRLMETYLLEVVVNGRLGLIEELALPDMVDEANQAFGGPPGRDGLVAHVVGFRRNVGNLRLVIDRIVAGTDEVMAWWSFTGTHLGPWLGRAPTGQEISGTAFSFFDLVDGRISRYRVWLYAMFDEPVVFDSSRPVLSGT